MGTMPISITPSDSYIEQKFRIKVRLLDIYKLKPKMKRIPYQYIVLGVTGRTMLPIIVPVPAFPLR